MQPLVSVEHESRQNAYRAEEAQAELTPSEHTPLVRFPQNAGGRIERHRITMAMVTLLLAVLITGIIIGVYLLILQSESENILPPVEESLKRMKRSITKPHAGHGTTSPLLKAKYVIVVQTDTEQCFTVASCTGLLRDLQSLKNHTLTYNYVVSPGGQTFEVLGWRQQSPMFPQYSQSALVLAFIGNFTEVPPNRNQVDAAKNLIYDAVSRHYLDPSFVIIGKYAEFSPTYLFRAMEEFPEWRELPNPQ